MPENNIHIIGYDEIVLLYELLGIEGTILEDPNKFFDEFNKLIKNPSIGIIFIALELPDNIIDYLIDFKLNNKKPFIYYIPDIFEQKIEEEDRFFKKIKKSIGRIIV
ncbi:MAG: V-type ATP synthase subunit F [Candidatus Thorarchaeota archaeon]